MNIQVHGDRLDVTNAMQEYVDKKIGRLEKYFDAPPEREVSVTMWIERGLHRVEVMLQVHGVKFRAEEESSDMYASVDLVADKLEQQIHRHKEKLNQRFRERGFRTRIKPFVGSSATSEKSDDGFSEDLALEDRVVRVKRFPMKPMDVEEAILQMDLLGHDFYVFTNAESDEMNVLYRRKDGNYGLIEPRD